MGNGMSNGESGEHGPGNTNSTYISTGNDRVVDNAVSIGELKGTTQALVDGQRSLGAWLRTLIVAVVVAVIGGGAGVALQQVRLETRIEAIALEIEDLREDFRKHDQYARNKLREIAKNGRASNPP